MAVEIPFAAQEGKNGVTQNSRETLINMYAEPTVSGKSKLLRRQRPGLRRVLALSRNKRGIERFTHGHYIVARKNFYRFNGTDVTLLGSLTTSNGPVTMVTDDNGKVAVADGKYLYHWDGTTFSRVDTPTFVGTIAFLDGFGIYAARDADQFYVSGLNDLTSWDALDFATAEKQPDQIARVYADHSELWFFGSRTTEIWRNAGAQAFPFQPNTAMERGCLAPFSVASDDNTVFWLGDDGIVYRADGYRPARLSTHEIEELIEGAPNKDQARAFIATVRGHKFYTLTFPGYATVQYNIATKLWNRAKTWECNDWQVVGGAGKPVDYYLTPDAIVSLDNGLNQDDNLVMERGGICAPVYADGERLRFPMFELNAEIGRVAQNAKEPKVMLQVSRNGEEFGNVRERGLGLTGNYARKVVWRNLGQAREFSLKITVTDDVDFQIISTNADIG